MTSPSSDLTLAPVPGLPVDTGVVVVAGEPRGAGRSGRTPSIRKTQWEALLASFRQKPADILTASNAAGVSPSVAKRAWADGWPDLYPSIREVIVEEAEAARVLRARREAEAVRAQRLAVVREEKAKADEARRIAVDAAGQEQQITQFVRADALLMLNTAARLMDGLGEVAEEVRNGIIAKSKAKGGPGIDPQEFAKLSLRVAGVARAASEVAEAALTLERVRTGKPVTVIGVSAATPETREEATAELAELLALLQQAQRPAEP